MVVALFAGFAGSDAHAITERQALNIAYARAGVSAGEVQNLKVKADDGVYEIEFKTAKGEYEFDIDNNGKVLEQEIELKSNKARTSHHNSPKSNSKKSANAIGKNEAERVAINASGISRSKIKYINSYEEYRSGRPFA